MIISLVGAQPDIEAALADFPANYHSDFFRVRALGRAYLAAPVSAATVVPLADNLQQVLLSWGAGRREAPTMVPVAQFRAALSNPSVHTVLVTLGAHSLVSFGVLHGARRIAGPAALANFDLALFEALRLVAKGLFARNTNVTYPMKAVLLITGLMPAFDSQVRKGLGRAGCRGMDKTRYLLPMNPLSADGKKITRLPFLLGECWSAHSALLLAAITAGGFPQLAVEPGRLFDVLLFMQGSANMPPLLSYSGPAEWYDFT